LEKGEKEKRGGESKATLRETRGRSSLPSIEGGGEEENLLLFHLTGRGKERDIEATGISPPEAQLFYHFKRERKREGTEENHCKGRGQNLLRGTVRITSSASGEKITIFWDKGGGGRPGQGRCHDDRDLIASSLDD